RGRGRPSRTRAAAAHEQATHPDPGARHDRRPGHPPDRTLRGTDRPDHPVARARPPRAGKAAASHRRRPRRLAVAQVLLRHDDERHWLRAAARLVGHLFPRLLAQSEYNTRLRQLAPLMEAALRWLADATPATAE